MNPATIRLSPGVPVRKSAESRPLQLLVTEHGRKGKGSAFTTAKLGPRRQNHCGNQGYCLKASPLDTGNQYEFGAVHPPGRHGEAQTLAIIDDDVLAGARAWRLWTTWAWIDMIQRYRRSVIGPFWATISMAMTIGGMGIVFATLFGQRMSDFLPYLAAGMITWQLIAMTLTESCMIFLLNDRMIRQFNLPLSIYAQRHVAKHFIVFGHHLIIFVLVAALFGTHVNFWTLMAPFGMALIFISGFSVSLLIGTLCARFRDIPPIVGNVVQLAFFVTPVMWKAELLGDKAFLAEFNPLLHFIEVVRRPMLGEPATLLNYTVVVAVTLGVSAIMLAFFSRFRHRIAFWL